MADGEGETDPRETNTPNTAARDTNSPVDTYSGAESNGYVTNGMASSEDEEDAPLDFSVKKTSAIPVQNLNNKLTNGFHRSSSSHSRNNHQHNHNHSNNDHGSSAHIFSGHSGLSKSPEPRPIKTESVSPPAGLSPGSDHHRVTSADSSGDKIGEPQLALPGMLPGALLPGAAAAGLIPMIPPGLLPTSGIFNGIPVPQELNNGKQQNGKRPFKAYNKDQINLPSPFGALPGMPQMPGLDMLTAQALTANSEEAFKQYKQYVSALQDQLSAAQKSPGGSSTSSSQGISYSGGSMSGMHSPDSGKEGSGGSTPIPPTSWPTPKSSNSTPTFTVPTSPESTVRLPFGSSRHSSQPRKRGRSLPEEQKDDAYWERRRKNNEAAKRSRDSRRAKEDQIAIRAAFLEQENLKLRVEVTALKNETAKLRCMLYNS